MDPGGWGLLGCWAAGRSRAGTAVCQRGKVRERERERQREREPKPERERERQERERLGG